MGDIHTMRPKIWKHLTRTWGWRQFLTPGEQTVIDHYDAEQRRIFEELRKLASLEQKSRRIRRRAIVRAKYEASAP